VTPSSHAFADVCEQLEVALLAGAERIALEVRDNSIEEEREASHLPLHRAIAAIRPERAAAEVPLDVQQDLAAVAVLADRQTRSDLPADPKGRTWRDRDREAALTVDVSGDVRREIRLTSRSRARVLHRF
jgi:hypothetical protein